MSYSTLQHLSLIWYLVGTQICSEYIFSSIIHLVYLIMPYPILYIVCYVKFHSDCNTKKRKKGEGEGENNIKRMVKLCEISNSEKYRKMVK